MIFISVYQVNNRLINTLMTCKMAQNVLVNFNNVIENNFVAALSLGEHFIDRIFGSVV